MNVLICGKGKGSFEMRGQQIGAALGARVTSSPTAADWAWAHVVILIKKTAVLYAAAAQAAGVPIIWDVLDCWAQPHENRWTIEEGLAFVRRQAQQIRPAVMIGATQRMAEDIGGVYIPHHCRLGLRPTPPREVVSVVAYDGSERYLGAWEPAIRAECTRRGWSFLINPPDLSQADILVAFRDGYWDGPICRAWKSGVKFGNALTAGRPIISQPSATRDEFDGLGGPTIETIGGLSGAFDECERMTVRQLSADYASTKYSVQSIADIYYVPMIQRIASEAACTA